MSSIDSIPGFTTLKALILSGVKVFLLQTNRVVTYQISSIVTEPKDFSELS
jgi:hypothetical protein